MTDLALNPFKKGKKTEVEGVKKVEIEDSALMKAFEQHNNLTREDLGRKDINYPILDPNKIDELLNYILKSDSGKRGYHHYGHEFTGTYITKLIQSSYNANYNYFILNPLESLNGLFRGLQGKLEKRLNVIVNGNVLNSTGHEAKYCDITINGNIGCGIFNYAENSTLFVKGELGPNEIGFTEFGKESTNIYKANNDKTYGVLLQIVSKGTIQKLNEKGVVTRSIVK